MDTWIQGDSNGQRQWGREKDYGAQGIPETAGARRQALDGEEVVRDPTLKVN